MRIPIYQLDAFASRIFSGNPAAVMLLDEDLPDQTLQSLAVENNLSETAFLVKQANDYRLRWFTPACEVPLCGHATLASGAVVLERLERSREEVVFYTASGELRVRRAGEGYAMDFPANPAGRIAIPARSKAGLGVEPKEALRNSRFTVLVLKNAAEVAELTPGMQALAELDPHGVIVTAAGDGGFDFVSRFFAPRLGVPEDPVTGSAHCVLTPYWSERLGKTEFRAYQASRRGGELVCRLKKDRVELEGKCAFYMEGTVRMEN
ncbi:MAG: PhzF family phenazine biosynthesis protein [Terracidiphilus sp.]|nr:PhzF family phenazine biosynthesis protein [Terracidiphilus sp.]